MFKTDRRHLYKIYKVKTIDTVPVELITNRKIAQMRRVFFEEILASRGRVISTKGNIRLHRFRFSFVP